MKVITTLCTKELLQFWRYKLTVALAFLLPLMTLLIYGFAIRLETKNIPLIIQNYDKTPLSREFIDAFTASNQYNIITPSNTVNTLSSNYIQKSLDTGKAKVGIIIPPDFTKRIYSNKQVNIQVLADGSDVVNSKVIKNGVLAIINNFMITHNLNTNFIKIKAQTRIWFNPGRLESLFIVPGVITVVLGIFPTIISSIAMVREKEESNIIQVYASGISAIELIAGKYTAYLLIALGEALLTITSAILIFGLRIVGNPFIFTVGTLLFISSSVLIGLMIGSFVKDQRSAIQFAGIIQALSAMLFSGFIYPLSNIPYPISLISYIVPSRYYMILIRDAFVRDAGFLGTWYLLAALLIMCLTVFYIAWSFMKKMQFD
jgi:ABC-2 type transport system permease protein